MTARSPLLSRRNRITSYNVCYTKLLRNVLMFDEPTNHLDLESITALNNSLIKFSEVLLFTSHDHKFVTTIANRIVELTPGGVIDRVMNFDEYLENEDVNRLREQMCGTEGGLDGKAA